MSSLQAKSPKSLKRPVLPLPCPLPDQPVHRTFSIFFVLSHPLPAPLAGAALILNAIAALDRRLSLRLDSFQREMAINGNMGKGTGYQNPYTEVLFLDGSLPSVAVPAQPGQPARAALPALVDVDAIRNLTAAQAGRYLTGHGVPLPQEAPARRSRVGQCVGCIIDLCGPNFVTNLSPDLEIATSPPILT
ncbi:hypothetical protein B0H10DRAFT_1268114 [Mycena sp. CBHHK59/15]|nr:hypothetical protein B0H10DRAFT_1268114 [Mycena sp. CBHHK59/15]